MAFFDFPAQARELRHYHALSKHRPEAYAPGPGRLDWATQPDPFRRYPGAPEIPLPLAGDHLETPWNALFRPGETAAAPMDRAHIGTLLEISLGLSAWKRLGSQRWALRCNPSSGNLHPSEGWIACPALPDLDPGLYHYAPREHLLERRARRRDPPVAFAGNLLFGLSSIPWREAWKYGARAFRYCQLDAGHALAALSYAARALGWEARLLTCPGDGELARWLGLNRNDDYRDAEPEFPEFALALGPDPEHLDPSPLLTPGAATAWSGQASRLSPETRPWPAIEQALSGSRKPPTVPLADPDVRPWPALSPLPDAPHAADLIRQRRSAQAYDPEGRLPAAALFRLLDALLPRRQAPPWNALPWPPRVHPLVFVHRVEGLAAGLYALPRSTAGEQALRRRLDPGLLWQRVGTAPRHLPLYLLRPGDTRQASGFIACHQAIAADGCVAFALPADLEELDEGPWLYRHAFWEAGMIGQVLYLEAEAAGYRGTGIGCFFDDLLHRLVGLDPEGPWQDLYHFTLGRPLNDTRLETLPPYAHREP